MQVWQTALCGMILKLDHSFKVVKRVRDATSNKQFAAVLTVMNEFCQVRCRRQELMVAVAVLGVVVAVRQHHAQSQGHHTLTPEELQQKGAKYWAAHCRRLVRPAAELLAELQKLMDKYRDARDPDLGNQQLFHALYTDQVYKAVLDLINSGSFCGERDGAAGARGAGLCVL